MFFALAVALQLAHAQPVTLAFHKTSEAESCFDAWEFGSAVEKRLGWPPFSDDASDTLELYLSRNELGFHAHMRRVNVSGNVLGERTLSSKASTCGPLLEASALAVAVLLDPTKWLTEPLPSDELETLPKNEPEKRIDIAPPIKTPFNADAELGTQTQRSPIDWHFRTGAGASQHFGLAPSVGVAGAVLVSLQASRAQVDLSGHFSVPQSLKPPSGTGSVQLGSMYAQVSPCGKFGPWAACATSKLGAFRIEGRDLFSSSRQFPMLWTLGARGTHDIRLSEKWALKLEATVETLLAKTFVTVNNETLWTSPDLVASGSIYLIFQVF